MTPEIRQAIADIQRQLDELRAALGAPHIETLRRRLSIEDMMRSGAIAAATNSDINQSVGGTSAFDSPKKFDQRLLVETPHGPKAIGVYNS